MDLIRARDWVTSRQWAAGAWAGAGVLGGAVALHLAAVPDANAPNVAAIGTGIAAVASVGIGVALLRGWSLGLRWVAGLGAIVVACAILFVGASDDPAFLAWVAATAAAAYLTYRADEDLRADAAARAVVHWAPRHARASTSGVGGADVADDPDPTVPVPIADLGLPRTWRVAAFSDPHDVAWGRLAGETTVRLDRDGASIVVVGTTAGQLLRWPERLARCDKIVAGPSAGMLRWRLGPLTLVLATAEAPAARDAADADAGHAPLAA